MDFLALGAESALCIWDAEDRSGHILLQERDQRGEETESRGSEEQGEEGPLAEACGREREITGRL